MPGLLVDELPGFGTDMTPGVPECAALLTELTEAPCNCPICVE